MRVKKYLDSFDLFGSSQKPRYNGQAVLDAADFSTAVCEGVAIGSTFYPFPSVITASAYPTPQDFANAIQAAILSLNTVITDYQILGVNLDAAQQGLDFIFSGLTMVVESYSNQHNGQALCPDSFAVFLSGNNDYTILASISATRIEGAVTYAPQFQSHQQNFAAAGFVL